MPRPKKIKPIKRQIEFDMNIPDAVGRSRDREMAKKILRQLLESQASGVNSGSKTGSFAEGRDYPEIALYQDSEGFVARPITSESANYKNGGMQVKRKYDNGGKTKKKSGQSYVYAGPGEAKKDMPFVRGRSEGFPLYEKERPVPTTSGIPGVGRPMIQGTRRAAPEKVTPIAAKEIDSGAGASKNLKKSNVSIPVPGKKKRKRRLKKYENGGKTKKDSVRTDTLERSVDQVWANARREEEERANERANSNRNNSGTTSGIPGVGRPLIQGTRRAAPAKVKTIAPKKINSGVSMDKTLKKSTAKISVPAEKKRKRRLRRRK